MILLLIPAVISAPIDVTDAAGPHHEHLLTQPVPDISERAARSAPPSATAGPDVWVYGYYPYWVGGMEDLAWDELSHIALFNVNLESDGTVSDTDNWHDMAPTAMALAEPYGVKVHLTLTCFDGRRDGLGPPPAPRSARPWWMSWRTWSIPTGPTGSRWTARA